MKDLNIFLQDFGIKMDFDEKEIIRVNTKRFLVKEELQKFILDKDKLTYIGKYLGKTKKDFIPSFILLDEIAEKKVNKIYLDRKAAWLFVCGRDIFEKNIMKMEGKFEEGNFFLVMMEDYCLGYGKADLFEGKKILKNLFDRGDFLRRERRK